MILPTVLTVRRVDEFLDSVENSSSKQFVIVANTVPELRPLAAARLLGFLARTRALGRDLVIETGEALPSDFFTESVIGVLFVVSGATFSGPGGVDTTESVRHRFLRQSKAGNGVLGKGQDFILPIVDNPDGVLPTIGEYPPLRSIDPSSFPRAVVRLLETLFPLHAARLGLADYVARYVYEIWHNTVEHGTTSITGVPFDGIRALLLSYHRLPELNEESVGDQFVTSFIESVRDLWESQIQGLLEVSVVDSGVGVPARLSGLPNIYEMGIDTQMHYLQRAVTPAASSKRNSGAGLGLPKAIRIADKTRGLIVFRTGHLTAFKHYLPPLEPWPSTTIYQSLTHTRGLNKGTQVSLLVPIAQNR